MSNKFGFSLKPDGKGGFVLLFDETKNKQHNSPTGRALKAVYHRIYDEGHNAHFVFEKETNIYETIQSHMDDCNIYNLLRRYANGDQMALQRVSGMYGDFSKEMSLRSMYDSYNQSRSVFDALSPEEKSSYNGDFASFLNSIGTVEGLQRFIQARVKPADKQKEDAADVSE